MVVSSILSSSIIRIIIRIIISIIIKNKIIVSRQRTVVTRSIAI